MAASHLWYVICFDFDGQDSAPLPRRAFADQVQIIPQALPQKAPGCQPIFLQKNVENGGERAPVINFNYSFLSSSARFAFMRVE